MKYVCLVMLLMSTSIFAQTSNEDPFNEVRTYLSKIQEEIDYAPNSKKEKIDKLNVVIRQGSEQKRHLQQVLKNTSSTRQQEEILREFSLILQAVVLIKKDINDNVPLSEDQDYLNKSIPLLLNKLLQ